MADDIVTRLRVIHCAADDLTPCGTCLPCQAADEIERLRAEVGRLRNSVDTLTNMLSEQCDMSDRYALAANKAEAEIERLWAAGDEMVDAATRQQWSRLDVAVAAWQEARRG